MIIEKHKDCGGDIVCLVLTVIPLIYQKQCMKCGEILESKKDKLEIKEI